MLSVRAISDYERKYCHLRLSFLLNCINQRYKTTTKTRKKCKLFTLPKKLKSCTILELCVVT